MHAAGTARDDLPRGVRSPHAPRIAMHISVDVIGELEAAGKSLFARFFEHMMFSGTRRYPDYDGETTKMGAFCNASTFSDGTQYYIAANTECWRGLDGTLMVS